MSLRDEFTNCESDVRLDGKVALVTGATSGTGYEIAKNFANRGARVIIASRNTEKLEKTKANLIESTGNPNVVHRQMDFESLKSVRAFVTEMYTYEPRLDILVNNIGAIGLEDRLTEDNLNLMMQVNYFGTFLLTFLLFPLMKLSAPSRIVNVSSLALILGHIEIDQMNEVGRYSNFGIYSNAKLADVLFTVEMNKRIQGSGVSVFSMDPGLGKSEFFRHYDDGFWKSALNTALLIFGRRLHRVATMSVFLAIDPRVADSSGKHFRDCAEFYSTWFANDTNLTCSLWERSKQLVRIHPQEDWETNFLYY
ncbi:retinol dehydrogenase 13-like [Epargyreus clarus]|uniref:retinol dehydrogenase 13-like n=1 Tax=Epargyreus clarus TaxID=520877 RepID=UPI003C2DFE27